LDLLPLIGFWVAAVLIPIALLCGILMATRLHLDPDWNRMTVPRWIGLGLGTIIVIGVLGYSLLEYLGLVEP
jgi:hypothetical protein